MYECIIIIIISHPAVFEIKCVTGVHVCFLFAG